MDNAKKQIKSVTSKNNKLNIYDSQQIISYLCLIPQIINYMEITQGHLKAFNHYKLNYIYNKWNKEGAIELIGDLRHNEEVQKIFEELKIKLH
jgi:hypothetical protein